MRRAGWMGFLVLTGCGLLDFDYTQTIPPQTLRGDPVAASAGQLLPSDGFFPSPLAFDLNLTQETKARGTGPASSVRLKSLTLALEATSSEPNFDWLMELHVFVESTKQGTALPKAELASLVAVPRAARTLELTVQGGVELLPYVNEGTRVTAQARARAPERDAVFGGRAVFRVKVF